MAHTALVVETKQLSNGAVAIKHRCCGDSTSDRSATMYISAETTTEQVQEWELAERTKAQTLHASVENARNLLASLTPKA